MSEVSESIVRGLQEMLDHAQGKIELRSRKVTAMHPIEYTAEEIKAIRTKLNMSQGFFADLIGVSKKTVESWEYGHGKPRGAASRLITIADRDPDALRRYGFAEW
ncbi:MAG: helix-turn-helix domain-containing protein [Oscillospiraceae bacterium]|nr:helix-turn-helix domain-containing protein [Oscillospiraceae bacterium]